MTRHLLRSILGLEARIDPIQMLRTEISNRMQKAYRKTNHVQKTAMMTLLQRHFLKQTQWRMQKPYERRLSKPKRSMKPVSASARLDDLELILA